LLNRSNQGSSVAFLFFPLQLIEGFETALADGDERSPE
jgi:hypothetical protein